MTRRITAAIRPLFVMVLTLAAASHLRSKTLAQSLDPGMASVPKGYRLIEGDILIQENTVPSATFPLFGSQYWVGGVVPYVFSFNVTTGNQTAMLNAMAVWEAVANVEFRPRAGEDDYVFIQDNAANNSPVGLQGGVQVINIVSWANQFVIVHELGHTLGFWHEQSRSDRDQFVQINWNNIQFGQADNFGLHAEASHYGPYDFDSLMHYEQCAFSVECPVGAACSCTLHTIDVLPPYDTQWQNNIGQRNHLSKFDALTMSFLYPANNWSFVDRNYSGSIQNGTFLKPYQSFPLGVALLPSGGTLWVQPGTYSAVNIYNTPMTIQAPLGNVTLSN